LRALRLAGKLRLRSGPDLLETVTEIVLTSGTLGTPVDFINTFAVEDKRFRSYRIVTKAGKHKVRFSKKTSNTTRRLRCPVTIRFQGQTYTVGVPTTAELDWHLTRIGYEWDPVSNLARLYRTGVDSEVQQDERAAVGPWRHHARSSSARFRCQRFGGIARGYLAQYILVSTAN
jgi:hypothetical protein